MFGATLLLFWSFFQFWFCFIGNALVFSLLCDCLSDAHEVLVTALIMVLLFLQCSCISGCCFIFEFVVCRTVLLFWSLLQFWLGYCFLCDACGFSLFWCWCCCLCNAPVVFVIVSILALSFVQCSCCFVYCSDFGVAFFVILLLFFVVLIWCSSLWYLIPGFVVVSILVFVGMVLKHFCCYSHCCNFGVIVYFV